MQALFPQVIGLHGCAGMPGTTKRKLAVELVGWGYVVLLVDSFATRPGRTMFGHWLEYNEEAAADASRRMREFLNRRLN